MNKTLLIIKREFLTRIKKKSFIVMTILGPILFAAIAIAPSLIMHYSKDEFRKIAVIDETRTFDEVLVNTNYIKFDFVSEQYFDPITLKYDKDKAKNDLKNSDYFALLYIPHTAIQTNKGTVELLSYQQPNMALEMHIANSIEKKIEDIKLASKTTELGITQDDVDDILKVVNTQISVSTKIIDKNNEEKESSTVLLVIVSYLCGFMIYMFVFMFGNQVMRGVIEEKTNRIVEIVISSVKPFQLMMGKIIGVGLVGISQFVIWIFLTFIFVAIGQSALKTNVDVKQLNPIMQNAQLNQNNLIDDNNTTKEIANIVETSIKENIPQILFTLTMFLIYFIGGFLLYSAMFAAIGSAVDNETDTQQFMLPISVPLFLGLILMFSAINSPNGSIAYWGSIIPFTSPIIMLARAPFIYPQLPIADIIISMLLLFSAIIVMTWLSSKIYRTGILMYGKKITWKELFKWLKYKN